MYRSLDSEKIIQTIGQLRDRISERFPNAGLARVASELLQVAHEAVARATWTGKRNISLRIGIGILILLFLAIVVGVFATVRVSTAFNNFSDFIQAVDSSFNVIVLIGAGIFFLISLEIRLKRKKALKMLHELRALAHIVDIHQLTKDPERIIKRGKDTSSSPIRTMTSLELSRYLDYCSEMLSLIGKLAALYAQHFDDPIVLEAVDEIEDLTIGLSRKIWQKISIVTQSRIAKLDEID